MQGFYSKIYGPCFQTNNVRMASVLRGRMRAAALAEQAGLLHIGAAWITGQLP